MHKRDIKFRHIFIMITPLIVVNLHFSIREPEQSENPGRTFRVTKNGALIFVRMSKFPANPLETFRGRFRIRNRFVVNLLAEFFATLVLLFVGTGICAQFILSEGKLNTWLHVNLGFGMLVMLCVYMTFHTSGGHFNPAVSLAMVSVGKLPLAHFIPYFAVQVLGAYLGAAGAYFVYYDEIEKFTDGVRLITGPKATAGLYTSFPKPHLSHFSCFVDQFAGTALLLIFVFAIIDHRNKIPVGIQPMLIGLSLFVVGCSFGMNLGYPINPARDLGPRLFAFTIGYGWEVFSFQNYYFWIPVIAPLFGAVFGAWFYQVFNGGHNLDVDEIPNNPSKPLNGLQSELEPLSA